MVASIGCWSCGFDVPPANYIHGTELIMVRHAVELGPLFPERIGPTFVGMEEAPIAEVLPGDRLRLEAVVVDVEGRAIPATELETLWLQCGFSCERPWLTFADPTFDVPCAEEEPRTTDDYCLLGTGDGRFELEVPELGPHWGIDLYNIGPHMSLYGVVAWDGRPVEECWASRRGDRADLDGCGFIYQHVRIGPNWLAMTHAVSLGYKVPVDLAMIPEWVLWQPANRVPLPPELLVWAGGRQFAGGSLHPPIPIEPGASIDVMLTFDPLSQSLQRTLQRLAPEAWKLVDERLYTRTATSGAIRQREGYVFGHESLAYEVDPHATAGISRVLIIYADQRGAADFVTLEFEVQ